MYVRMYVFIYLCIYVTLFLSRSLNSSIMYCPFHIIITTSILYVSDIQMQMLGYPTVLFQYEIQCQL